jgi:hypothetical protein
MQRTLFEEKRRVYIFQRRHSDMQRVAGYEFSFRSTGANDTGLQVDWGEPWYFHHGRSTQEARVCYLIYVCICVSAYVLAVCMCEIICQLGLCIPINGDRTVKQAISCKPVQSILLQYYTPYQFTISETQ